jgi:Rps23 Pro-64 3,4-dihydroxylase Tpa1-like proline 4-hydroxylase
LFSALTPNEVLGKLRSAIDEAVALNSSAGLFIHAGVVGWRGRAIVIPGRSMTGKSTLVAALVRRGATYYSDEFAVLDREGRVHPYARMPVFRSAPDREPDGHPEIAREAGRAPLPVSLIVSTTHREGATWRPRVLRGARAVLPLIDNTLLARMQPEQTVHLAAKLAPTAVTLEGVRPDADVAAARILEFLDAMVDGAPLPEATDSAGETWKRAQAAMTETPARIVPARYIVVEGVLEPEEHARLLQYAVGRATDFATSSVMAPDGTSHVDLEFRRSGTIFDAKATLEVLEARLRKLVPHVRRELGLPWFPVGRVELQMAVHEDGGFFGAHTDDGREEVAGRQLTCVYYFHGQPKGFDGGELAIYDSAVRDGHAQRGSLRAIVPPADNTAVFFPSGAYHEVQAVRRRTGAFADSRFSVNVWFWLGPSPLPPAADASPRSDA